MAVRVVVFDVGGVLEHAIDTYLDGRWEQRLGLAAGEFLARLRRAGLGQDANLGGSRRQRTCHWLGVRPDEVVFLDDIEANVVAAREVGMHAVLFQHTTQSNHRGRCVPFGCGWLSLTADGAAG